MAVGRSVQFRGIDATVDAYRNQDVIPWGLFQGTQFMQKYQGNSQTEGAEFLEQYLRALDQRSADGVTYTLAVYDNLARDEKIKSGTKYDASFNFRLVDNIDAYQGGRYNQYEQKIAGLQEKIKELTEEPMSAKDQFFNGLGKILDHPDVQQLLATKFVQILDGVAGAVSGIFKPMQQTTQSAGAARPAAIGGANLNEENAKLQEAVNFLVTIDAELGTHLLQLANIAKADPAKYNMLIGMLKNF